MGFISPDQGPLGGHIESETEAGKFKRMRDSVEGPEPCKRLKLCVPEVPNEPNLIYSKLLSVLYCRKGF